MMRTKECKRCGEDFRVDSPNRRYCDKCRDERGDSHLGTFFGCYGPEELKATLVRRAQAGHRTLSQELVMRLEDSLKREEVKAEVRQ